MGKKQKLIDQYQELIVGRLDSLDDRVLVLEKLVKELIGVIKKEDKENKKGNK